MNGAVAFDIFDETQYSDAHVLPSEQLKPKQSQNDFTQGEDPEIEISPENPMLVLPIKEIKNQEYRVILKKQIPLYLEGDNRGCVAIHEESRICGEGKQGLAALRDFEDSFISVFLSYSESKEPLSSGAQRYLQYLKQLVATIEKI